MGDDDHYSNANDESVKAASLPPPPASPPVKACLMAPTFSPSPPSRPGGGGGAHYAGKEKRASSAAASSSSPMFARSSSSSSLANTNSMNGKKISCSSSVDNAVRRVYKKVRRERDLKRKELVRSVLGESRDGVINGIISGNTKQQQQHNHPVDNVVIAETNKGEQKTTTYSNNNNASPRHDDKKYKKRECVAFDIELSPTRKKKKKKMSRIMHDDVAEEKKNDSDSYYNAEDDDDDDGENNKDEMILPSIRRRSLSSSINDGKDDVVHSHHGDSKKSTTREGGGNGSGESLLLPQDDTIISSHHHHQASHHPKGGSQILAKAKETLIPDTSFETLVFPRLPSNNCPVLHQFFVPPPPPPLCQPCEEEEEGRIGEVSLLPRPPNLSNPNNDNKESAYTLTIKSSSSRGGRNNKQTTTTTTTNNNNTTSTHHHHHHHQPLLIEGTHPPRPKSSSLIFLKSALAVDDEPNLAHVPYFGDGDNEDIYSELFDTTERERLWQFGPKYQEVETFETIDEVLKLMAVMEPRLFGGGGSSAELLYEGASAAATATTATKQVGVDGSVEKKKKKAKANGKKMQADVQKLERIHYILSELTDVEIEVVHERHLLCFAQDGKKCDKKTKASTTDEDKLNGSGEKTAALGLKKNSDTPVAVPYESIMDSYRDLLCRRCFTYDCNIHGNLPKANLDLLGELAVQKERDGHWKELDKEIVSNNNSTNNDNRKESNNDELTPAQQSICKRAYLIFQGDIEKVASAIGAMPGTVDVFIKSKKMELSPNKFITAPLVNRKRGNRVYSSMKNYNQKWLRRIQSKVIHPSFLPCDHDEPCNDETCSCVQNGFFCTKHCGWGSKSPNFFRGCECKAGQCRLNSCACYAAKRECDPDLCRTCGACSDPPDGPATGDGQRCRNDNISMRRHAHLLIAESRIKQAGWGLFTKHALKKGDFVHEYVGEIISQEEAERRGVIYDKLNMSYLFNLSSDFVVDSTRKGNKARYANHSSTPNIEPKMIHVNGDMRIGFFAKHDIDAQSELFFDYRYDDQMDNELFYKPDHSVNFDWMKKNNQGQKKNS